MKRVQLIVTGDLERVALHRSLKRFFPDADFLTPFKQDGFTSARIGPTAIRALAAPVKPTVRKLADALIAEVEPRRRRHEVPDLVVVVEDLELANAAQPQAVTEFFVTAAGAEMQAREWGSMASRTRAARLLADRCSFHLLAPMTEAYFYGEPEALARAESKRPSRFSPAADVEGFTVEDPAYEALPDPPWKRLDRARHPKRYLDFLSSDITEKSPLPGRYRETNQGKLALDSLAWDRVLADTGHAPFARSLFEDIADALGVPSPVAGGACAQLTQRKGGGCLRNL